MIKEIDQMIDLVGRVNGQYFATEVKYMDPKIDLTMRTGKRGEKDGDFVFKQKAKKYLRRDKGDLL